MNTKAKLFKVIIGFLMAFSVTLFGTNAVAAMSGDSTNTPSLGLMFTGTTAPSVSSAMTCNVTGNPPLTTNGTCPSGATGSVTYSQYYGCPNGLEPGAYGPRIVTGNTCVASGAGGSGVNSGGKVLNTQIAAVFCPSVTVSTPIYKAFSNTLVGYSGYEVNSSCVLGAAGYDVNKVKTSFTPIGDISSGAILGSYAVWSGDTLVGGTYPKYQLSLDGLVLASDSGTMGASGGYVGSPAISTTFVLWAQ